MHMIEQMMKNLVWLGHSSFCLKAGGKIIYFDPYRLSGKPATADIILVSHDHFDHCSPEDIEKIQTDDTIIVTEPQAGGKLSGNIITLQPGENCKAHGIPVEAVPSYNTNKKFHPEENKWLGFVITVDGVRIYHAGDTDYISAMKSIKADIALLPVSGTYVMTAEEAVLAALDINPQVAVPMHYGTHAGNEDDARRFAEALEGKIRVKVFPAP